MNALLVCAAPLPGFAPLLAELIHSHDLIVGVDAGGGLCLEAGIVPDLVVGDLDSIDENDARSLIGRGVDTRRFPADKDVTDLDLAIDLCRARGVSAITLTCATSGRLDHTLAVMGSVARNTDLCPQVEEPGMRGWFLAPGAQRTVRLSGPGTTVSVVALISQAVVSCTGVTWPLDSHTLEPLSSYGVSNVITAESAVISVHDGVVLVTSTQLAGVGPARRVL